MIKLIFCINGFSGKQGKRVLLAALFIFLQIFVSVKGQQVIGYTKADVSVGESGDAKISIPINTPMGTFVQPSLSLTYSSHGSDGLIGLGWSLEGAFQVISRIPATLEQDGINDGVNFNDLDRFALNGERLMVQNGASYGADGVVYFTEQNIFSKIISYGNTGFGPMRFRVWTKDGLILDFGATADSRIEMQGTTDKVTTWLLNRVEDISGNFMTISYTEDNANGEFRPSEINYTGNSRSGRIPYNRILFYYANKATAYKKYLEGSKSTNTKKLVTIEVRDHTDLYRRYALDYVSGTDKLSTVTEYGFDNSSYLKPVQLSWASQPSSAAFNDVGTGIWVAHDLGASANFPADFNGDGKTDFAAWQSGNNWKVSLSRGDGFQAPTIWQGNNQGSNSEVGDFNGDGKADLIAYTSGGNWTVSLSTGSNFINSTWQGHTGGTINNLIGDYDGDGRTDIAMAAGNGNWKICLSTGTNFNVLTWSGGPTQASSECFAGDFNGDGKTDIIGNKGNGNWAIAISTGTSFITGTWASNVTNKRWANLCDLNGDGLTDIASWSTSGSWNISLSTGKGFQTEVWTGHNGDSTNNFAGDFNGDGKTDFAKYESGSSWKICLSTGTGFLIQTWSNGNSYGNSDNLMGDFNGDGFTDMAAFTSGTNWRMYICNQQKDFIVKIRNGNGVEHNFSYEPLTDTTVYKTTLSNIAPQYPNVDFSGSLYVVKSVSTHDALGNAGAKRIFYKYYNAKFNLTGRGFLGFTKLEMVDTLSNIKQITDYELDYRYASASVKSSSTYTISNKLISSVENNIALLPAGENCYFSFYNRIIEHHYELNGNEYLTKITKYNYDNLGNALFFSEVYNNSYVVQTLNSYSNDTSNWKLSRLLESTVTKSLNGTFPVAKKAAFGYNSDGILIKEISLPDITDLRVQKDYLLDINGNRIRTFISGPDFSPRSDSTVYDVDGRFAVQSFNALRQSNSANYANGLLANSTDANEYITVITRDNFGRETNIQSGTNVNEQFYTNKTYEQCNTACPTGTVYVLTEQNKGEGIKKSYFDMHDQPLRKEVLGFNNKKIFIDYQYNTDGTQKAVSDPYYENDTKVWTNYSYDELKRITVQELPGSRKSYMSYSGLSKTTINPLGQQNIRIENAAGKLVQSIDNSGNSLYYYYDGDMNLLSVKDPLGNETKLTYDLKGNKLTLKDPDMGSYNYRYDALGMLKAQFMPTGDSAVYEFDLLNRTKKRIEKEGTTEWVYDPASCNGKVSSIVQSQSGTTFTDTYSYLRDGRTTGVSLQKNNEAPKQFTYSYNNTNNKLSSETYPDGAIINYSYDGAGYLTNVYNSSNNYQYWQSPAYNAEGQLTEYRYGNGLITRKAYDLNTGFLQQIQVGTGNTGTAVYNRQNLQFSFDATGNLTQRKDIAKSLIESFKYDGLKRIISAQVGSSTPLTMQYDMLGNITYKSDVGKYYYAENGTGPHVLTRIDHSNINNCFTKLNQTISYTSYNYVKQISNDNTSIDFVYGPERERREQTVIKNGQVKMYKSYWGGMYEEGKDSTNRRTELCFVRVNGVVIAAISKTGINPDSVEYYHTDHLGSVVAISNTNGLIVQEYSYDSWGRARNPVTWQTYANETGMPKYQRGFTFHEMLDMDFLVCMNARIYNPVLGRFLSPDPFVQFPDNLQGMNRFSYVLNNPLSFTDPSGHFLSGLKKLFKKYAGVVVGAAIAIGTGGTATPFLGLTGFWGSVASGAAAGFGSSFTNSILNGGGLAQSFQAGLTGGLIGGLSAGLMFKIDKVFPSLLDMRASNGWKGLSNFEIFENQFANSNLRSSVNGVFASINGGSFRKSFFNSLSFEGIGIINAEIIINNTKYQSDDMYSKAQPTFELGEGEGAESLGFYPTNPLTKNAGTDPSQGSNWFARNIANNNSPFMNVVNAIIPGINYHANVHDAFVSMLYRSSDFFNDNVLGKIIANGPTQSISILNYGAILNRHGMLDNFQKQKKLY